MLINLIKFIHILLTLGLFGLTAYCLTFISSSHFTQTKNDSLTYLNKIILIFAFFAAMTGTLLVYPKHFTFHTPWILAAYVLVFVYSLGVCALILFRKQRKYRWLWYCVYGILILILVAVIHDAVTKNTFLLFSRLF